MAVIGRGSGEGVLPLDFLINVANDAEVPLQLRIVSAHACLPHLHAKMLPVPAAILDQMRNKPEITVRDLERFDDAELDQFEKLLRKLLPPRGAE
jgi:hypothetical protein